MGNITLREGFLGQRMIVLPKDVRKQFHLNPITNSFFITDLGYYPNANNHHRTRDKGANEYIFIYCTEGEGWVKLEDKKLTVRPNQFFMIPKHLKHSYGAHGSNPWSIYWIHFDGLLAPNLFERYWTKNKKIVSVPFDSGPIKTFDQIFGIYGSSSIDSQMEHASILGLNFIGSFIFKDPDHGRSVGSDYGSLVDSIIDFMVKNLDKPYRSEDIARNFNYSQSYIFSLFKRETGYSLIHFFNLKKIQKSCEYIKYTDMTLKEISFKLGYQDPLYYSRIFKKYMGTSPKQYRIQLEN